MLLDVTRLVILWGINLIRSSPKQFAITELFRKSLENSFDHVVHLTEVFGMILGTSTGSLISFGLVVGAANGDPKSWDKMDLQCLIERYHKATPIIFGPKKESFRNIYWPKCQCKVYNFPTEEPVLSLIIPNLREIHKIFRKMSIKCPFPIFLLDFKSIPAEFLTLFVLT